MPHSQQRGKKADLKNEGGLNVTDLWSSKSYRNEGIKSLHSHFQIGNVMSELDLRGLFRVKREKIPVKRDSPT